MSTGETETAADLDVPTTEVRNLTAFQRNVLTVLAGGSTYGLGIKRELETFYDDDVNHGRLYPNLDDLVEMRLVDKGEIDKRTNEYTLTEQGYAALFDQLEWTLSRLSSEDERTDQVRDLIESHD